jgi:hypothetical protein
VSLGTNVTATISEPMDPATLNGASIQLLDPSAAAVPATVSYDPATLTVTLDPTAPLSPGVLYTALVRGGSTDPRVKDVAGNALVATFTWNFTTVVP